MYRLLANGVERISDGLRIPNDPSNRHWMEYQEWAQAGNTPAPEFTEKELIARQQTAEAETVKRTRQASDYSTILTGWRDRVDAISNVNDCKAEIRKLYRLINWIIKDNDL